MLLKELASTGVHLPEIGFGTWNYARGVEPVRAAMQYGACLIDTAEAYGTEEIVGQAVKGQNDLAFFWRLSVTATPRGFAPTDTVLTTALLAVLITETVFEPWFEM